MKLFEKSKTKNFSVTRYCRLSEQTRCNFYRHFNGATDLFKYVLVEDLKKVFFFQRKVAIGRVLQNLLEEIYQYRNFYRWIYYLMSDKERLIIKKALLRVFRKTVLAYAMQHQGLTHKNLYEVCEGIYDHLHSWLVHDCNPKLLDVFQIIKFYIPIIEGRCSNHY